MSNNIDGNIDIFQQALAESVHFSVKTINSNIAKGGLRLSQSQALDLPYISARTLLADGLLVPTDYQANAGKTASTFKVVKAAMLDDVPEDADDDFKSNVLALKPQLQNTFQQPFQAGTQHIDVRMRQLLIPQDREYIALSPLSAAGVNLLLNNEVDRLKEQRKKEGKDSKLRNIQSAVFGIGGANPQNVGSLVRSMQRPLVMTAPTLKPQHRLAFQYFYKGFEYQISSAYINFELYKELYTYSKDLEQQAQLAHDLDFPEVGVYSKFSNMKERLKERSLLEKILNDVLTQGDQIYRTLKVIEQELPSLKVLDRLSFWSHPQVNKITQGLIDPKLQQFEDWQIAFADHLASKIIRHRYWNSKTNQDINIDLDQNAQMFLSRRIQELLK